LFPIAASLSVCGAMWSDWQHLTPTQEGTAHTLEAIRKKHDLPALALVVVKDGKICDCGQRQLFLSTGDNYYLPVVQG
jgi:hypothetical protein